MSKTITTISLYGDISYKNNNNNHNAYVYLQLKKRCLIQKNQSLSSISSNPKNLHNIISILDTTSNKGLLATVVSSDGVKVFKIQDAHIVKKDGIRTIRLTTSNKELHSKDNYAKNVTQIFDDNVLRSASVLIYTFSLVNNTPLCAPNCRGVDLSGRDLSGADLSGADLIFANLSGANLSDANLRNSIMRGARLNRANLSRANLSKADLRTAYGIYVNLSNAIMTEANMEGSRFARPDGGRDGAANLSGANLTRATLDRADLTFANLTSVWAYRAQAVSVNLAGANLTNARLMNANLRFARFTSANLTDASLVRANVDGAIFEDVRTSGSQTILTNTDFRGATNCSRAFGLRLPPRICNS